MQKNSRTACLLAQKAEWSDVKLLLSDYSFMNIVDIIKPNSTAERIPTYLDVRSYVLYDWHEVIYMKTVSITKARQNIYRLVEDAISSSEPLQITARKGNVVLVSEKDWKSIQETLYLLSVPGMRESLIEGVNTPIGECKTAEEIGWDI